MKTIKLIFIVLMAMGLHNSVFPQADIQDEKTQVTESESVAVYYFHFTRRCATCNAVEDVSKEAVQELYGDRVIFEDFNLEEESGEEKGEELEVAGQTLLIVSGDTRINITNEAFMNARTNPEKLKQIIQESIDPLI